MGVKHALKYNPENKEALLFYNLYNETDVN